MNELRGTRAALLLAARHLFARHGYDGTSIKMITTRARANLGAVTYHFGTKKKLYHEVLKAETEPLLIHVRQAGGGADIPLDRIAAVVRAMLQHMSEHRDLPALMLRELSLDRPVPALVRRIMVGIYRTLRSQVEAGQNDRSIVAGDPALMTVSIVAQPIYLALARKPLRTAIGLDTADPTIRVRIADHVVSFLRRGLAPTRRSGR